MIKEEKLQKILDIGIALTAEKNPDRLLSYILDSAMELTNCDAGSLYILKDGELVFRVMKTISKGVNLVGKDLKNMPAIKLREENVCAYSAIHKESLNIEDVYNSSLFDFSGPKSYDSNNNYRTCSMVAIPMIDHDGEVIGVMQLINAQDESGNVIAFDKENEHIITSLASQTAVCLSNMAFVKELDDQMWSFTEALTEVIDMRTPYNGNHTKNVAKYVGMVADYINELHVKGEEELHFSPDHIKTMVMSAYLHDIGKVITPMKVMNKQTRLEGYMKDIESRFEKKMLLLEIDFLKGDIEKDAYDERVGYIKAALELAHEVDSVGFLSDELEARIDEYKDLFTDDELVCMRVKKGTLTAAERKIMEDHVAATKQILDKVYFNKSYQEAPIWAARHHEALDGSGYPNGIDASELSVETRILSVADVCDALLATDRPYKKPLPKEKAFAILESMADEGKLDMKFVNYLEVCIDRL